MAQVKRFFHVRDKQQPRGGATVYVVGDDDGGPVRVQIAYCSPNDQFCRSTGRAQTANSRPFAFPLKGLPGLLHKVAKKVLRRMKYDGPWPRGDVPRNWRQKHELAQRDWSFATKYWTPKIAPADLPDAGLEVIGPRV